MLTFSISPTIFISTTTFLFVTLFFILYHTHLSFQQDLGEVKRLLIIQEKETERLRVLLKTLEAKESTTQVVPPIENFLSHEALIKIVMSAFGVILLLLLGYYLWTTFFTKTIIGKVLMGVNSYACSYFDYFFPFVEKVETKHIDIPFNTASQFQLRLNLYADQTCNVQYKDLQTNGEFLPFNQFLTMHQNCIANHIPVERIQNVITEGSVEGVINSTTELISTVNAQTSLISDASLLLLENNIVDVEATIAIQNAFSTFF